MVAHPVRRTPQAFFERHLRLPPAPLAGPRVVTEQPLDLAAARSHPAAVNDDLRLAATHLDEQLGEISDRYLPARAHIDHVAKRAVAVRHCEETARRVVYIVEVPRGGGRAKLDLG